MMHRCGSSSEGSNMVVSGPCSCGFFHSQNSPFSMIFSHKATSSSCNNEGVGGGGGDHHHMYSFGTVPVVDCTLSLGTPSSSSSTTTTLSAAAAEKMCRPSAASNYMSSTFRSSNNYDLFHPHISTYTTTTRGNANFSGGGSGSGSGCETTILARRCANCDTTSTPLWRNGPKGPKSLCNACGIRYKKEERRATAAATSTTTTGVGGVDSQLNNNSWVHHSHNQKASYMTASPYGNEFRFIQEDDNGSIPFLSWRLNVTTDRSPGLIHNLTTT